MLIVRHIPVFKDVSDLYENETIFELLCIFNVSVFGATGFKKQVDGIIR